MLPERFGRMEAGKHTIEVKTEIQGPGRPGVATISVDGAPSFTVELGRTVPAAFTATETFDVGTDLGSPESLDYAKRRPFSFEGTIGHVHVQLTGR